MSDIESSPSTLHTIFQPGRPRTTHFVKNSRETALKMPRICCYILSNVFVLSDYYQKNVLQRAANVVVLRQTVSKNSIWRLLSSRKRNHKESGAAETWYWMSVHGLQKSTGFVVMCPFVWELQPLNYVFTLKSQSCRPTSFSEGGGLTFFRH